MPRKPKKPCSSAAATNLHTRNYSAHLDQLHIISRGRLMWEWVAAGLPKPTHDCKLSLLPETAPAGQVHHISNAPQYLSSWCTWCVLSQRAARSLSQVVCRRSHVVIKCSKLMFFQMQICFADMLIYSVFCKASKDFIGSGKFQEVCQGGCSKTSLA